MATITIIGQGGKPVIRLPVRDDQDITTVLAHWCRKHFLMAGDTITITED